MITLQKEASSTESYNTGIETVQNSTVAAIQTLSDLVAKIGPSLSAEKQQEYGQLKVSLDHEAAKIQKLELTTAVVAPMSSGKSTTINAIVGQELLPVRNAAMTTFPTEVALKPDLEEARLLLPESIIDACTKIVTDINKIVKKDPAKKDASS
jgi:predicted GTPase